MATNTDKLGDAEAPHVIAGRLVALVRASLAALAAGTHDPATLPDALIRVETLAEAAGVAVTDAVWSADYAVRGGYVELLRLAVAEVAPELVALAARSSSRPHGDELCPVCFAPLHITEDAHGATVACGDCDYVTGHNLTAEAGGDQ